MLTVVSIDVVDSALMLWVVPAKSAFTIWTGRQPSLSRKLQRSTPPTERIPVKSTAYSDRANERGNAVLRR